MSGGWDFRRSQRALGLTLGALVLVALGLAGLHLLWGDRVVHKVHWFDLDHERNFATWFSGTLFSLFGAVAALVGYLEWRRNRDLGRSLFRLPVLWLGVAGLGFAMSLDEITILHENLLWKEVRAASSTLGQEWHYITQWQILYAPAILVAVVYMVAFFANRFAASRGALYGSLAGIGCWVVATLLEGVRESLEAGGWYAPGVVVEELLEMAGAICLIGAIAGYGLAVALDFDAARQQRLGALGGRLLSRRALVGAASAVVVLLAAGWIIHGRAEQLAADQAPVPALMRRVLAEAAVTRSSDPSQPTPPRVTTRDLPPGPTFGFAAAGAPLPFVAVDTPLLRAGTVAGLLGLPGAGPGRMALAQDVAPRIVFVSATDGSHPARVHSGRGLGLAEAVRQAMSAARAGFGAGPPPRLVKLDLVAGVEPVDPTAPVALDLGRHGLAFAVTADGPGGGALEAVLLPEEVIVAGALDDAGRLRWNAVRNHLRAAGGGRAATASLVTEAVSVYAFVTDSFVASPRGVEPLYRGHELHDLAIDPDDLLAAARAAGDYLVRVLRPDGQFDYVVQAATGFVPKTYNILRHAGTAYALIELFERTREPPYLAAAERALGHLRRQIQPCQLGSSHGSCVVEGGSVKLGGNALAVIALARYAKVTGDRADLELMRGLANWMLADQDASGRFVLHKVSYPQMTDEGHQSAYYPGEALLALMRLDELEPSAQLQDAAVRGALWLIETRDGHLTDADLLELDRHDHWLLYALAEIHRRKPHPQFPGHARRLAAAIVATQHGSHGVAPDWAGGWDAPPTSTKASIRVEGLAAAYRLLRDNGASDAELTPLAACLDAAAGFLLRNQLTPSSAMHLFDPQRAAGGWRRDLTSYEVRIDYVQHAISALLQVRDLPRDDGGPSRP